MSKTAFHFVSHQTPTLDAVSRAIEERGNIEDPTRGLTLGMSVVGEECRRKAWYKFHFVFKERFDAATLLRFEDGHAQEDVMAARLRLLPNIELHTHDENGKQYGFTDFGGHSKGFMDGVILGLLEAPKTWHVWEHKATSEKKFNELKRVIEKLGEKSALREWNPVYYTQAQLYMLHSGLNRHYMTVSTAGGREYTSIRTEYNPAFAEGERLRSRQIIFSQEPLDKVMGASEQFYACKLCPAFNVCHKGELAPRNCRTCIHSTPTESGTWHCERHNKVLDGVAQRAGCPSHMYLPRLVDGEVIEVNASYPDSFVRYKMKNGTEFIDKEYKDVP